MLVFSDVAVKDAFPYVIATGGTSGMGMGVLKALARAEVLPMGWEKIKRHRMNGTMTFSECAETYLHRISREARASIPYIRPTDTDTDTDESEE